MALLFNSMGGKDWVTEERRRLRLQELCKNRWPEDVFLIPQLATEDEEDARFLVCPSLRWSANALERYKQGTVVKVSKLGLINYSGDKDIWR